MKCFESDCEWKRSNWHRVSIRDVVGRVLSHLFCCVEPECLITTAKRHRRGITSFKTDPDKAGVKYVPLSASASHGSCLTMSGCVKCTLLFHKQNTKTERSNKISRLLYLFILLFYICMHLYLQKLYECYSRVIDVFVSCRVSFVFT